MLGTPGYMAPEQVRGEQVDHRTDVFAFGAVLYEMLAGRRAFSGQTAQDVMSGILRDAPAPLPSTPDRPVSPALARIVERCLEKSPAARFQSTTDLAFALKSLSASDDGGLVTPAMVGAVAPPHRRPRPVDVADWRRSGRRDPVGCGDRGGPLGAECTAGHPPFAAASGRHRLREQRAVC